MSFHKQMVNYSYFKTYTLSFEFLVITGILGLIPLDQWFPTKRLGLATGLWTETQEVILKYFIEYINKSIIEINIIRLIQIFIVFNSDSLVMRVKRQLVRLIYQLLIAFDSMEILKLKFCFTTTADNRKLTRLAKMYGLTLPTGGQVNFYIFSQNVVFLVKFISLVNIALILLQYIIVYFLHQFIVICNNEVKCKKEPYFAFNKVVNKSSSSLLHLQFF